MFYSAIINIEVAREYMPITTIMCLMSFLNIKDNIYYAAIQIVDRLNLRTNAVIDISFLGAYANNNLKQKKITTSKQKEVELLNNLL